MTITPDDGAGNEELGYWYSPARVAIMINQEREACAKICDKWAEAFAAKADATDDAESIVNLKAQAWQFSVLACEVRGKHV